MRMEWSGDVDLNDGALQQQYASYISRLKFIQGIGLGGNQLQDLLSLHELLESDLTVTSTCKFSLCMG